MIDPATLDFAKGDGLIPVVVQDAATLQVLTLAYMDRAALDETIASGEATFFSRSRGGRWRKGETSGDRLHVVSITPDCDAVHVSQRQHLQGGGVLDDDGDQAVALGEVEGGEVDHGLTSTPEPARKAFRSGMVRVPVWKTLAARAPETSAC